MIDIPKVVFSRTLEKSSWINTTLATGKLIDEIVKLKKQSEGKDIIVYGGAEFVSSLVQDDLIDELNLFINPTAIGKGLRIFLDRTNLQLIRSQAYECGVVVNTYSPKK